MSWEDIIYVALLLLTIAFGPFYRKIEDPYQRQWTSTVMGLLVALISSGRYIVHPLLITLVNAIVITKLPPKKCHLVSFFFSFFSLLVVFRLQHWVGLPFPPSHTNLIMMIMTLKLSGLAFEVNAAANVQPGDPEGANSDALKKIDILDVFHYSFSYMGLLTGPYYRYRTYWDSLHRPFSKYVDPWPITFYKLKQIAAFAILFLALSDLFASKYVATEDFMERSFLYRYWYMYPQFCTFRLRIYIGTILAECGCQMAGIGAYPTRCNTIPGLGPRDYKTTVELSGKSDELKDENYDFNTVYNMNVGEVESCISVRTAMKRWNACVQYWMATCVYKRFPHKRFRTLATFILSALWHGYAPGYYFCICQIPFFLMLEDVCTKLYQQSAEDSFTKKAWTAFLWYYKTTSMAYLGVPFQLLDINEVWRYYNSVYFAGQVQVIVLYIIIRSLKPCLTTKRVEDKDKDK